MGAYINLQLYFLSFKLIFCLLAPLVLLSHKAITHLILIKQELGQSISELTDPLHSLKIAPTVHIISTLVNF